MLLGPGCCLAPVSWRSLKQNSDRTLDSTGSVKHPDPKKRFALRSKGFLTPNMLVTVKHGALGSAPLKFPATLFETGCTPIHTWEHVSGFWTLFWAKSSSKFPGAPLSDPKSSCGFPGIMETSGCPLFRLVENKYRDLAFGYRKFFFGPPFLIFSTWCPCFT